MCQRGSLKRVPKMFSQCPRPHHRNNKLAPQEPQFSPLSDSPVNMARFDRDGGAVQDRTANGGDKADRDGGYNRGRPLHRSASSHPVRPSEPPKKLNPQGR